MGFRSTLASFLSAPAARLLERDLRELVEDILATRAFARTSDLEALRADMPPVNRDRSSADARLEALETELEALKKKLGMTMGAVQAATTQLQHAQKSIDQARSAAAQASQQATTARATAEAALDGLTVLEDALHPPAPHERMPPPDGGDEAMSTVRAIAEPSTDALSCQVPDCRGAHRAKGFCGRHYQQYRRNKLDGFVGPDGIVPLEGRAYQVDKALAGHAASLTGTTVTVGGHAVDANPA